MMMGTLATTAGGQCKVSANSHEGKLLVFYGVPLVFAATPLTADLPAGGVRFGVEVEPVPKPRPALQQTSECFFAKSENTSLSPVFARPRVTLGLPGRMLVEASYIPPLKIANAKAHLGSLSISHSRGFPLGLLRGGLLVTARVNATAGTVQGPITCPRSALQTANPAAPCYGKQPSNDTFEPRMYGADVIAAIRSKPGNLALYGGIGAQKIYPIFEVGFTDGSGKVDRTRVQLLRPATRLSVSAGITVRARSIFDFGAQLYSVPAEVTTIRLMGGLRLR